MQAAGAGSAGQGRLGRGGPADHRIPHSADAAGATSSGASPVARAQSAPGPSGDAEATASRPGNRLHIFALRVSFPSPLEADIAHGSLAPDAEPHRGVVRKDLTVNGSVLAVRWRAEDSGLLRISIINFLDQLCLVMRTLQRFGTPLSR
ncbi:EKC/KEOPS complex subunit LAGE3 [Pteropus alecto]|uniref:EKC/KEOPS complex subunit LAGE3 n=1 Tax=Pteropus alecto TaxID=9402 RepID=UPI00076872E7|nr:EKC/KEOPS complex subunit LAGE3 [Pteropus alecto]